MEPSTKPPSPPTGPNRRRVARLVMPPPPPAARTKRRALPAWLKRDPSFWLLLFITAALVVMGWSFFSARRLVTVSIGDKQTALWTRQTTVRSALVEAGISWNPEDVIRPSLDDPLPANGRVTIRLALPVVVEADGMALQKRTQKTTIAEILKESQIQLKPADRVYLDGRPATPNTSLFGRASGGGQLAIPAKNSSPARITVERSVPISVNDNGLTSTIYTTERTLGAALQHSGLLVYLGDQVSPDLGTPVTAGASVFIRRSRPATIVADGRTIKTRTRGTTVADLLAQEGVQLAGKDFSEPSPTSPVLDGTTVKVTRIREVYITETIPITYQVRWLPNPDMEIDTRAVAQQGGRGEKDRLFKEVYENGKLVSRGLEREWIAKPPQDRIINYGTKIVVRDLTLPDGKTVQYWRTIRMLATAYTAATSGKPRSHPEYGLTFLGLTAGKGVVAVDPKVISLRSNVYVPGYGIAIAGDTGGKIQGRHIDLGYPENQIESWYRWVDVYLLTPVPPANKITYIIPDFPQEKTR